GKCGNPRHSGRRLPPAGHPVRNPSRPRSLRSILTRGLVLIQILVLVSFTLAATVPIINILTTNQGLDETVMDHIARSISRRTDGALQLDPTPALLRVRDNYSQFMFYAVDANGHSVSMGDVPGPVYLMTTALTHISSAN